MTEQPAGVLSKPAEDPAATKQSSKRVAVLFNGPSLPRDWRDSFYDSYDLVFSCNTSGFCYRTDWVAASDKWIFRKYFEGEMPRPKVGFICCKAFGKQALELDFEWIVHPLGHEADYRPMLDPNQAAELHIDYNACKYTAPNLLLVALRKAGPEGEVDIYGMDYSGTLDYFGCEGDHKNNRWLNEGLWMRLIWDNDKILVHGDISEEWMEYIVQ